MREPHPILQAFRGGGPSMAIQDGLGVLLGGRVPQAWVGLGGMASGSKVLFLRGSHGMADALASRSD